MTSVPIRSLCAIACLLLQVPAHSVPPADQEIAVHVRKERSSFDISFEFTVPASARETWDVLADYEHMAQFVSSIESIDVVSRNGNRIEVAQRNHGSVGPLHVSVDGLRRIDLLPYTEIRSHLVKGDLKASDFTTRLIDEGATTRVKGDGRIVLSAWSAWAVGADSVEKQTRRQYQELRDEILRRASR
jgi:uncharacterized protein YndB with AHSA1/START domain